jgi:hypothetical protein
MWLRGMSLRDVEHSPRATRAATISMGRGIIVVVAPNYLFRRKDFGLCAYRPRNAELRAMALTMGQD